MSRVGVVVIGRNEGERLARCLTSLGLGDGARREGDGQREADGRRAPPLVYVDSGSTDGSVAAARRRGADVVELDGSAAFTAARARNAGWSRLTEIDPDVDVVQFVDGDCEVVDRWLETAARHLETHRDVAVVCGRRRERFPERTIFNRLCDIEWDTPVGEALFCGGDSMMRVAALREVGGFDDGLIAGEEPDLCFRLRRAGWRVLRLAAEMTLHDADMRRFGQWWRRNLRAGHAYAENSHRHAPAPDRFGARETRSNLFWGLALPGVALGAAVPTGGWSLALLAAYAGLATRIARFARARSAASTGAYALWCSLGKLPQALGQLRYHATRRSGGRRELIEYK